MNRSSFTNRYGINQKPLVYEDFPKSARNGLVHILTEILQRSYKENDNAEWRKLSQCLQKASKQILQDDMRSDASEQFRKVLAESEWYHVYEFCEIYYARVIEEAYYFDQNERVVTHTKDENQEYFTVEMNALLQSEYVGYDFKDGQFIRRGYSKTQATITKSNQVLGAPRLEKAKKHFNKALKYFQSKDLQDAENSIKECICALEATLNILWSSTVSSNFSKEILRLSGSGEQQAPRPLLDALIKVYGYRNSASGVAHAPSEGLKVSFKEAELILNLTGSYITYFYDLLYVEDDDIPF